MKEFLVYLHDSVNAGLINDEAVTGIILADRQFSSACDHHLLDSSDIAEVHECGFRCLIKMDRLFEEEELDSVRDYLRRLENWQADGVIYTDLGVKMMLEETDSDLEGIYAPETLLTDYYDIESLKNDGTDCCVISKDIPLRDAYAIMKAVPDYCMIRIHGPILIAYSRRNYINAYLDTRGIEYTDGYYVQEETRKEKLRMVEKSSGNWLYGPCLQSFSELKYLVSQPCRGMIMDNVYLDDEYTLKCLELYKEVREEKMTASQALEQAGQLNYMDINELKETWLEKENNED